MNEDAVNIRRIDMISAFPVLRLLASVAIAVRPVLLVLSLITVASLTCLGNSDTPGTMGVPGEVFSQWIFNLEQLAVHGLGAGGFVLGHTIVSSGLISIMGAAVAFVVAGRICQSSNPSKTSGRSLRHVLKSLAVVWSLSVALLISGFVLLRTGQWLTRITSADAGSGIVSALPAILAGLMFQVTSAILLVAWLLSMTSIVVERCSGAEALSRCISYILSRPIRTLAFLAVIFVLGFVARLVCDLMIDVSTFLLNARANDGKSIIHAETLSQIKRLLGQSVTLSLLMSGVSLTYLLLRHAEDGISISQRQN